MILLYKQPLKKVNKNLIEKKARWVNRGKFKNFRRNIFKNTLVIWLILSNSLILISYPIYVQTNENSIIYMRVDPKPETEFGIWTYGQSLDDNKIGEKEYASNETLQMLADEGIYLIYGINQRKLNS